MNNLSTAEKVKHALLMYGLKEIAPGQYRCNSPLRPNSDSMAFSLTIHDGEHGVYFDHVTEESGTLYNLAEILHVEIVRLPVENSKCAYPDLEGYARAKGVSPEVFEKAGWKDAIFQGRPVVEFATQTGIRRRFLDGNKPVYKSPVGYKRCWYGTKWALGIYSQDVPLVLCNGEASTVVAQHYGIPAICATGGEHKIPVELIRELESKLWLPTSDTPILIALDCDKKGREAAQAVAIQFINQGFTNTRVVDLMLGKNGDLADFCKLHGEHALPSLLSLPSFIEELKDEVDEEDDEGLLMYDITELHLLPVLAWLLAGIIPQNAFVMLFGEANVGKTFWALHIALQIALNHLVVYVAGEGEAGLRKRVYGWCKHHEKQLDELQFKVIIGYVSLFEQENVDAFIALFAHLKPALIVVDTLSLVTGAGDENNARDMNLIIRTCRRIKRKTGCTILFIHHTGKSGDKERGSSVLRGRMDMMIQILPHDDLIAIECAKTRDEKPFATQYMKLLPIQVDGEGETLIPVPASQVVRSTSDPLTSPQRRILEVMLLAVNADGISFRDIEVMARLSMHHVQTAVSNLATRGYVNKPKVHWVPTEQGREAYLREANQQHEPNESDTLSSES